MVTHVTCTFVKVRGRNPYIRNPPALGSPGTVQSPPSIIVKAPSDICKRVSGSLRVARLIFPSPAVAAYAFATDSGRTAGLRSRLDLSLIPLCLSVRQLFALATRSCVLRCYHDCRNEKAWQSGLPGVRAGVCTTSPTCSLTQCSVGCKRAGRGLSRISNAATYDFN